MHVPASHIKLRVVMHSEKTVAERLENPHDNVLDFGIVDEHESVVCSFDVNNLLNQTLVFGYVSSFVC